MNYYGYIYLIKDQKNNKVYIGQKKGKVEKTKYYYGSGKTINQIINKDGLFFIKKIILGYCNSKEELNNAEVVCIDFFQSNNTLYGYNLSKGGDGGDLVRMFGEENPMYGKKGKACPRYVERESRKCVCCDNIFEVLPKSTKKYCNKSCYLNKEKETWIYKDNISKRISVKDLDNYINDNWMQGRPDEFYINCSNSKKGILNPRYGKKTQMTDETKLKISIANTGKIRSEESKEKNRQAHLGKKHNK